MDSIYKSYWIGLGAGIIGFITGHYGYDLVMGNTELTVPRTKNVESGFVVPSELEIKCQDLDRNGTPETILRYKGQTYLLKYDGNQPTIVSDEVKPTQPIIPFNISK